MPTIPKRAYFWPPWSDLTRSSNIQQQQRLSQKCRHGLTKIAKRFQKANLKLHRECEDYLGRCARQKENDPEAFKRAEVPQITSHDCAVLEVAWNFTIPKPDGDLSGLLAFLSDTDHLYFDVWAKAVACLLASQGISYSNTGWYLAKQAALDILELRDDAAKAFQEIEEELRVCERDDVCDGILVNLKVLARFIAVYNRQPSPATIDDKPPREPLYDLFQLTALEEKTSAERPAAVSAYPQHSDYNPTLLAVALLTTVISIVPIIFAWLRSPSVLGSTSDADFWLLLQNSILQLLGLFISIYPLSGQLNAPAWRWVQAFTIVGSICSIAAVPMYLYLPAMWSALIAFCSSVIQAFMALQLAFIVDSIAVPGKEDWMKS